MWVNISFGRYITYTAFTAVIRHNYYNNNFYNLIAATGSCSHMKSYHYFAHSILSKEDYVAVKCSSWDDYQENKCNDPENASTFMGEHVDAKFVFVFIFVMKYVSSVWNGFFVLGKLEIFI